MAKETIKNEDSFIEKLSYGKGLFLIWAIRLTVNPALAGWIAISVGDIEFLLTAKVFLAIQLVTLIYKRSKLTFNNNSTLKEDYKEYLPVWIIMFVISTLTIGFVGQFISIVFGMISCMSIFLSKTFNNREK